MEHDRTEQMTQRMRTGLGFIAALDQSGGSTPKALKLFGVDESQYANDAEMFDRIHEMRSRIILSPAFNSERILASILFEMTMERQVDGMGTAEYLWERKGIVPFVKIDQGLADESDGVRLMKPMPELGDLLTRAKAHHVFGTKMRSVINGANPTGIQAITAQQFDTALVVLQRGLVPIVEPEVDINCPDKADAERLLKEELRAGLDALPSGEHVILKLTLPSEDGFYGDLLQHRAVLRIAALSGGYSREESNALLARNPGVIASFSRALTEGLRADMDDATFDSTLDASIQSIYDASCE
jgi:fructose-bisphosphate aldolase, class I